LLRQDLHRVAPSLGPALIQAARTLFRPANLLDKVAASGPDHQAHEGAETAAERFGHFPGAVAGDGLQDGEDAVLLGIGHIGREPALPQPHSDDWLHPLVIAQQQFVGRRLKGAFLDQDHQGFVRQLRQIQIVLFRLLGHHASSGEVS
jgi:hypothetical protein